MTRALLITGARSLADDHAAEAWARGIIAEALAGCDLLIVGDAPGPDAWAREIACNLAVNCNEYLTRGPHAGMITEHRHGHAPYAEMRWTDGYFGALGPRKPLHRNRAMVDDAASLRDDGHDVRVLALLDGRKPAVVKPGEKRPTRGTEHTARLAEDAGLTVDARTWAKGATT